MNKRLPIHKYKKWKWDEVPKKINQAFHFINVLGGIRRVNSFMAVVKSDTLKDGFDVLYIPWRDDVSVEGAFERFDEAITFAKKFGRKGKVVEALDKLFK